MLVIKGGLRLQFQVNDTVEQTLRRFAADLGMTFEELLGAPVATIIKIHASKNNQNLN